MFETGVPNLDLVLGGGIPTGDSLLVLGSEGVGKTTLCLQMAFHVAAGGGKALFVSTMSEPIPALVRHARGFAFFDDGAIEKTVFVVTVYPLIREDFGRVLASIVTAVEHHEPALLVIDGLMTMRDLAPDDFAIRALIYELGAMLFPLGCTTVLTSSAVQPRPTPYPELTVVDGILELGVSPPALPQRALRVRKMRGQAPLVGQHAYRIDDQGFTVFPRGESLPAGQPRPDAGRRTRMGVPELDRMMKGGPPCHGLTLCAGAMGTGKTLLCLHFLAEGLKHGEPALFAGFGESAAELEAKGHPFGLDLGPALREGRLATLMFSPVDLVADEVAHLVLREVERHHAKRLALDGIADLEHALDPGRQRGFMAALARALRGRGVTSLVTKELVQIVGPELDFSESPLAVFAENLLLLRVVELRGELFRVLSVLKMRESDFDSSIRQYRVDGEGIHVLTKVETAEGILTGIAHLPSERRAKR